VGTKTSVSKLTASNDRIGVDNEASSGCCFKLYSRFDRSVNRLISASPRWNSISIRPLKIVAGSAEDERRLCQRVDVLQRLAERRKGGETGIACACSRGRSSPPGLREQDRQGALPAAACSRQGRISEGGYPVVTGLAADTWDPSGSVARLRQGILRKYSLAMAPAGEPVVPSFDRSAGMGRATARQPAVTGPALATAKPIIHQSFSRSFIVSPAIPRIPQ